MITYEEITTAMNDLVEYWEENGKRVIECAHEEYAPMSMTDFLNECTTCGGNWGGMLLTGVKKLYPKTYEAIPDDMGCFAFAGICNTLLLCGVYSEQDSC